MSRVIPSLGRLSQTRKGHNGSPSASFCSRDTTKKWNCEMITTLCPSVFGNLSPVWKFDNNALQVVPKSTEFFAGTPPSQIFIFHRNRLVCVSDRKIRGRKTESYLHRSRRRRWRHQRTATIAHLTPTERSTSARCDVAKRLALARDVARTSASLSLSLVLSHPHAL